MVLQDEATKVVFASLTSQSYTAPPASPALSFAQTVRFYSNHTKCAKQRNSLSSAGTLNIMSGKIAVSIREKKYKVQRFFCSPRVQVSNFTTAEAVATSSIDLVSVVGDHDLSFTLSSD
jgi:hypothetical protein